MHVGYNMRVAHAVKIMIYEVEDIWSWAYNDGLNIIYAIMTLYASDAGYAFQLFIEAIENA